MHTSNDVQWSGQNRTNEERGQKKYSFYTLSPMTPVSHAKWVMDRVKIAFSQINFASLAGLFEIYPRIPIS